MTRSLLTRRYSLLALCAILLLAACAPTAREAPRTSVEQLSRAVGFYPDQAGARWEYLQNNAPIDDPRVMQLVEGPRVVGERTLISHLTVGAGAEERKFRSIGADGVLLYARHVPGAQTTYEPAIMEFPPASQLVRGASWGGTTNATTYYPQQRTEFQYREDSVRYRYTVVDRRQVRVPAGSFDVYVINLVTELLTAEGDVSHSQTQELWYSPYVGEIRTVSAYYLTGLNFEPVYP